VAALAVTKAAKFDLSCLRMHPIRRECTPRLNCGGAAAACPRAQLWELPIQHRRSSLGVCLTELIRDVAI